MSRVYMQGTGAARLQAKLAKLKEFPAGLGQTLTRNIANDLYARNRSERLAGKDIQGRQLAPLRGGRPLTPAEIKARGGTGKPLCPRGENSRVITGFYARESRRADGGWELIVGWRAVSKRDFPFLQAHADGRGRYGPIPRRNILGISPMMRSDINKRWAEFEAVIKDA